MKNVFYLKYLHFLRFDKSISKNEDDYGDEDNYFYNELFIGMYSTYENALEAIERLSTQSGFCDDPYLKKEPMKEGSGFYIDEFIIDKDYWTNK